MSLLSHLVLASSDRQMSRPSTGQRGLPHAHSGLYLAANRGLAFLFNLAAASITIASNTAAAQACSIQAGEVASVASWHSPLDRRVSLHVRDISLPDALDRISSESTVRLSYTT